MVRPSGVPDRRDAVRAHRTPLRDWFYVMFQFCASRNGVAAKEVERQLGVTYKTAWRMCHEIRKYMAALDSDDPLGGAGETVEIDETIVGGSVSGMGNGYMGNKTIVVGMLERGGELMTRVVTRRTKEAMHTLSSSTSCPARRSARTRWAATRTLPTRAIATSR